MKARVAYWQHEVYGAGRLRPCRHRWLWTSRLHCQWWRLRERVGDMVMALGAKIAGQYEGGGE